ncbi:nitrobindin family protein [Nocardiopsis quinghaiensis]|uniref:FABP family protein n=1 Tax=Nocardiopsis quinghaiensis TaxID=464995 RepID=UPI0012387CB6|nr:FABP family protein [Nocardiopsis quinghaiensis]
MDAEVHPDLAKLSFLLGRWKGVGVAGYADVEEFQFGQEIEFSQRAGLPYMAFTSRAWRMTPEGDPGDLVAEESGYWRVRPESDAGERGPGEPVVHLEALIAHPEGFTEVYLGNVFANRVEMSTDAVVHTETGIDATASHRLYGLFGDNRETLGYAWDLAARGHSLRSYMSAQLKRVGQE